MTETPLKILIIGGYGIFGGRIAELLADQPGLELIIAGRSLVKAEAFCKALGGRARRTASQVDRNGNIEAALAVLAPALIVDASGPFQAYGHDPYRVVRAAIAQGCDYLDLADGSDFVAGVAAFDTAAKARGVAVVSGASSFPALSAGVVRHLARDLASVETITAGIAPSPFAVVGFNVIEAIASYAGKPVKLVRDGRPATGTGLAEPMLVTISPPGRLPLRATRFSLVDVPDLQLLPPLWPGLRSIWMGAGPVPEILHRGLNALAHLVRWRVLPTLSPLASLFFWVINHLRWGEHRGGMFVAITGRDRAGQPIARSWHLLAEGRDGPFIPSMAVEAIVRRRLGGVRLIAGARSAVAELELADYERLFAKRTIYTGERHEKLSSDPPRPLFATILGDAWDTVPTAVRDLHDSPRGQRCFEGRARVDRGRGALAQFVANLFRLPLAAEDVPLRVTIDASASGEVWTRSFGGQEFKSTLSAGTGRNHWLIDERFGPFTFSLALVCDGDRLRFVPRRWRCLGMPLPAMLVPHGEAFETTQNGRFLFDVEIALPLIGRIVHYRGTLAPVSDTAPHHDV